MSDRVRITPAYLDFIMESLKYATPQIHMAIPNAEEGQENDGIISLDERDFGFIYDAVQNYRNYLQKELPKHKKGSAKYNKAKKALDMIPKINATFFSTMVF